MKLAAAFFVAQLAATLFMTGLIWFVQIVHYPLFAKLGPQGLAAYAQRHATLTGRVVFVPMVIELAASMAALWTGLRIVAMSASEARISAALVLILWASTGLVQVPLHERLGRGQGGANVARLVATNWVRTAAWTARSLLLLAIVLRMSR